MKITILGAGAYGTALGEILTENQHEIEYYSLDTKKTLIETIAGSEYVILCVPSKAAAEVLKEVPKSYKIIVATKGILDVSILDGFREVMALSGPGFADDIKKHQETCLTTTNTIIDELFKTDYLEFDHTTDLKGLLLCGALKNVYAIEAGLRGLERETPTWHQYIKEALSEMKEILSHNEAKPATADLYCGIGDLKLTCGLPSRNFAYGLSFHHHEKPKENVTVEGLTALSQIKNGMLKLPENANIIKELLNKQF